MKKKKCVKKFKCDFIMVLTPNYRSRTDTSGHHSSSNSKYENPASTKTAASKTDSGIYESHTGMENSDNSGMHNTII